MQISRKSSSPDHKAIFWDFDGTLAQSPMIWSRSVRRALEETDPSQVIDFEALRELMREGFSWHTPDTPHPDAIGEKWWAAMDRRFQFVYEALGVPVSTAKVASHAVRPLILDPAEYQLYEDTLYILTAAQSRGWQNYILSNNYPELPTIVKALGIADFFAGMIVSGSIGYDKPHPEIFSYARALAGYPSRCIMVGDNPKADIAGGTDAGMATILVHRDANCNPTWRFATLREIEGVL